MLEALITDNMIGKETRMALSGKLKSSKMDVNTFTKAFVASLVAHELSVIRPHHADDRRGFTRVIQFLDTKIAELEQAGDQKTMLRQLVRITNQLRQSNTGGFEGFEAALRGLQLTFVNCPNPFYDEVAFTVSKSYAESTVNNLPELQREIVTAAADVFLKEVGA